MRRIAVPAIILASLLTAGAAAAQTLSHDTVSATRVSADKVLIRWQAKGPVDVLTADTPSAPPARMRKVSDDDLDGQHSLKLAPGQRPHVLLRDERTGATIRVAERLLPLAGGSNFRDLGGYPAAGGKTVRWGRIYRTGAMPKLEAGDRTQVKRLGITSLTDLRSVDERQMSPTDWRALGVGRYNAVDYPASDLFGGQGIAIGNLYETWPVSLKRQYRQIFEGLLAGQGATAFNCSAGQDRTGVASALVLSALGVPREIIYADYHLSTAYRRPENEIANVDFAKLAATNPMAAYMHSQRDLPPEARKPKPLMTPSGEAYLAATFRRIERDYGSVERYLDAELGVDKADIARLRALYLE
ncbi:tyrosine-protein phosphatase [Phenylobacterium sp.]|uniref:tyrosine-protein phosphatase n=1 Tax=Phenylobacterium sp. TaxID=1871053 RepID=UPI00286CA4ED|nr:tyrosine-protein phosphatase [Phenylobacterium sp.]